MNLNSLKKISLLFALTLIASELFNQSALWAANSPSTDELVAALNGSSDRPKKIGVRPLLETLRDKLTLLRNNVGNLRKKLIISAITLDKRTSNHTDAEKLYTQLLKNVKDLAELKYQVEDLTTDETIRANALADFKQKMPRSLQELSLEKLIPELMKKANKLIGNINALKLQTVGTMLEGFVKSRIIFLEDAIVIFPKDKESNEADAAIEAAEAAVADAVAESARRALLTPEQRTEEDRIKKEEEARVATEKAATEALAIEKDKEDLTLALTTQTTTLLEQKKAEYLAKQKNAQTELATLQANKKSKEDALAAEVAKTTKQEEEIDEKQKELDVKKVELSKISKKIADQYADKKNIAGLVTKKNVEIAAKELDAKKLTGKPLLAKKAEITILENEKSNLKKQLDEINPKPLEYQETIVKKDIENLETTIQTKKEAIASNLKTTTANQKVFRDAIAEIEGEITAKEVEIASLSPEKSEEAFQNETKATKQQITDYIDYLAVSPKKDREKIKELIQLYTATFPYKPITLDKEQEAFKKTIDQAIQQMKKSPAQTPGTTAGENKDEFSDEKSQSGTIPLAATNPAAQVNEFANEASKIITNLVYSAQLAQSTESSAATALKKTGTALAGAKRAHEQATQKTSSDAFAKLLATKTQAEAAYKSAQEEDSLAKVLNKIITQTNTAATAAKAAIDQEEAKATQNAATANDCVPRAQALLNAIKAVHQASKAVKNASNAARKVSLAYPAEMEPDKVATEKAVAEAIAFAELANQAATLAAQASTVAETKSKANDAEESANSAETQASIAIEAANKAEATAAQAKAQTAANDPVAVAIKLKALLKQEETTTMAIFTKTATRSDAEKESARFTIAQAVANIEQNIDTLSTSGDLIRQQEDVEASINNLRQCLSTKPAAATKAETVTPEDLDTITKLAKEIKTAPNQTVLLDKAKILMQNEFKSIWKVRKSTDFNDLKSAIKKIQAELPAAFDDFLEFLELKEDWG